MPLGMKTLCSTTRGCSATALLTFKDSAVVLLDTESARQQPLNPGQVLRSGLISDMATSAPEGCTALPVSADLMNAWMDYTNEDTEGVISCERLAVVLQVADLLIDEQTIDNVAKQLANRVILNSWMPAWCAEKVLRSLPRELVSRVLAASNASVPFLLQRLPASQHVIALCSLTPAIEASNTCALHVPDNVGFGPSNFPAVSLISAIGSLTDLTSLELTGCHLHEASAINKDALTEISKLEQLKVLNLANNGLKCSDATHLFPSLRQLPLLQLNVADNDLGDAGVVVLSEHLSAVGQITLLNISNNSCSSVAAEDLGFALHSLPKLRCLRVSENRICSVFVQMLVPHLLDLPELRELYIAASSEGPGFGNYGAVALAEALWRAPKLEVLNVDCNRIGVMGCMALTQHLSSLQELRTLDLGRNRLGPGSSIFTLAHSLMHLTGLEQLTLQGAEVYNEGAVALASFLPSLVKLRLLNLGGCGLTMQGLTAVGGCLVHLRSLQNLTLKYNLMFAAGLAPLLPALAAMKKLEVLSLRGCALGSTGVSALASGLVCMSELKHLDLAENGIRCEGAKRLASGLSQMPRKQLELLCLDDNLVGLEGSDALWNVVPQSLSVRGIVCA